MTRENIAKEIEDNVFRDKTIWSLIFPSPREAIKFVTSVDYSNTKLFEMLERNVRQSVGENGGDLGGVCFIPQKRRVNINHKNSENLLKEALDRRLPVTFKVKIKNKYYEFIVQQ